MSTYANTLTAYSARLKAQRRAAEREAQAAARAKTAEQKAQDRARIATQRAIRKAQATDLPSNKRVVEKLLNNGLAAAKDLGIAYAFRSGERAQITQDLVTILDLYLYEGHIAGFMAYKIIDTTCYSRDAFALLIGTLGNLNMIKGGIARCSMIINENFRKIAVARYHDGSVNIILAQSQDTAEQLKKDLVADYHANADVA